MSEVGCPQEIAEFINLVLKHFAKEARRLNDPGPLTQSRDILHSYFTCLKQLGTVEHGIAVQNLRKEMKVVAHEARRSRQSLSRRAQRYFAARKNESDSIKEAKAEIRKLEADIQKLPEDTDPEINQLLEEMTEAFKKAVDSKDQFDKLHSELESALLQFDLQMHFGTYTRLGMQSLTSAIGKHLFIFLVPVLAGIVYSWITRQTQSIAGNIFHFGILGILTFTIVAALFKEYVISKKITALRLKVECWLLVPVTGKVMAARIQGLMQSTFERQPNPMENSRQNIHTPD